MARKRSRERLSISDRLQVAFGNRLKLARRSCPDRYPQAELASALGVSRTTVSNIESGRHRIFLDQAYLAARALGVRVETLLPTFDEVFREVPISTAADMPFDAHTARAAAEFAQNISIQIAAGASAINKNRGKR